MGLLDVLSGMSNAQSGQRAPGSSGGGMSPITKAIIGVLAYQAIKAFTSNQARAGAGSDKQSPGATGGGLDDLLKGGLGGLLGGGGAGTVVSVAAARIGDGERVTHRHRRIDGVAAALQRRDAGLRRERLRGRDDVLGADRLTSRRVRERPVHIGVRAASIAASILVSLRRTLARLQL